MKQSPANRNGMRVRAGARGMIVLAAPLNVAVISALADRPMRQIELRRAVGFPAETTLRAQLKRLRTFGLLESRQVNRFPAPVELQLSRAGHQLLRVADVADGWLKRSPHGPTRLGSNSAKAALKALAEAWSSTMLRALASGPRALTELDRLIAPLSYPALERRLNAMRLAGQIEPCPRTHPGTPYALTSWARYGLAPLTAAAQWERRHLRDFPPTTRLDAEAAFLLLAPLLRPAGEVAGSCRMVVDLPVNGQQGAGVIVEVAPGGVAASTTRVGRDTDAWVSGDSGAWLAALADADTAQLEFGGDSGLAQCLLDSIRAELFPNAR